jgi:hypothetical protein
LQYVSPYRKPEPCSLSFRPALPSFTSLSLPMALSKPIPSSSYLQNPLKLSRNDSLFLWFQSFHLASVAIMSRYNPEPPPMEIICAMTEWQDTQTVSGLIVRATEYNVYLTVLEKFQILYLLAFASKSFLLKIACVLFEIEDQRMLESWLEKIPGAVEKALIEGEPEETFFDTEHQLMLMSAYERIMGIPYDISYLEKLSVINLPSLEPGIYAWIHDIFASDQSHIVQTKANDCTHLFKFQQSIGVEESDDEFSDGEFWNSY